MEAGGVIGQDRPRPVLVNELAVSLRLDDCYLSLKGLAGYTGLSVRRLRNLLLDPTHPLPCYRIGGKILVRRSEYDAWAASYRQMGQPAVNRIVTDVLRNL